MTSLLTRTPIHTETEAGHPSVLDPPPSCLHGSVAEGLALVVAPSTGRFHPAAEGLTEPGEVVGHVTGGQGRADAVVAPVAGAITRLLVRPGQLVSRGQGLVWLQRGQR